MKMFDLHRIVSTRTQLQNVEREFILIQQKALNFDFYTKVKNLYVKIILLTRLQNVFLRTNKKQT